MKTLMEIIDAYELRMALTGSLCESNFGPDDAMMLPFLPRGQWDFGSWGNIC